MLAFVNDATNMILLGPPGVWKTHLSVALALKAIDAGHPGLKVSIVSTRLLRDDPKQTIPLWVRGTH